MQTEFPSDLEILDYLELFNSTVISAEALGLSQSSCSRRYRAFSEAWEFGFDRIGDRYQATRNLDVLQSLRQASQRSRVRQGRMRFTRGWQLGRQPVPMVDGLGSELPIRPMNSLRLLSLLEQRLLDMAVMGIMEFQPLLNQPLSRLRLARTPLGTAMMCIPICTWDLQLLAHRDHPLQGSHELDADVFAQYSSPGLSLGAAPLLMSALQSHGLGTLAYPSAQYEESAWEGSGSDGHSLSYAAPHLLPQLERHYQLERLNYDLDICECLAIVAHRDVISDPSFADTFRHLHKKLAEVLSPFKGQIAWLS